MAGYILEFINKNNIPVYDEKSRKGVFRHIIIKYGMKTDEVMCVLVLTKESFKGEEKLAKELINKFTNIKTIIKNINIQNTNVILGNKNVVMYGSGYIQDKLRRVCI